ncbi:peptidyl-tRNA hydrolase II domain-containing protein [Hyaloraphidium curvatum]|nr:peptidyl-tRNA hydrolase II domain-containing protein [Hyaloraphidium curvatum]
MHIRGIRIACINRSPFYSARAMASSEAAPRASPEDSNPGSVAPEDPLIQYLVLRKDLVTDKRFKWTHGMLMAQAAHASTALIWKHRDSADVQEYMQGVDTGTLRKVVTEVPDEATLRSLGDELRSNSRILVHEFCEQPEDIITCTAIGPCRRSSLVGSQTLGDFMRARTRLYR